MTARMLDVNQPVLNRKGEPMREPKLNSYGQMIDPQGRPVATGAPIMPDSIQTVEISIGMVITSALDRTDERLTAEERRKRFALALRIEEALSKKASLEIDQHDEKRIREACDALTNPAFLFRVHEALSPKSANAA